jgi:hypothetical protein
MILFLALPCEYIFSIMNCVVNTVTKNIFRQTQLHTVLTRGIGTICIDQTPNSHVLKTVITILASKYQQSTI